MKFTPTAVNGAFIVEADPAIDERGRLARAFCAAAFASHGLVSVFPQCNISTNWQAGTLRGLHWQIAPGSEAKLVRAVRGRVFDVALDLRAESPSFLQWASVVLDARHYNAFYIPAGCAHGFLTLEENCELFYLMSTDYIPDLARGVRWDDPAFGIIWPDRPHVIGTRDASYPNFSLEMVR